MQIILFVTHQMNTSDLGCFNPGIKKKKFKMSSILFVRMKNIHISNFNNKENLLN